jgi:hypothetical protein
MKVYVGGKLYDAKKDKIAIILEHIDKLFIMQMHPHSQFYIVGPDEASQEELQNFSDAASRAVLQKDLDEMNKEEEGEE